MNKKFLLLTFAGLFIIAGIITSIMVYVPKSNLDADEEVKLNISTVENLIMYKNETKEIIYTVHPREASVSLICDNAYVSVESNSVTTKMSGETKLKLIASFEGRTAEKVINLKIMPVVENVKTLVMKDTKEVTEIKRGLNSSGKENVYTLNIVADANLLDAKFISNDIEIVSNIEILENQMMFDFIPRNDKINYKFITKASSIESSVDIKITHYLTSLDVELDRYVIYNISEEYKVEAEKDNFFNYANILSANEYTYSILNDDVVEIRDNKIFAKRVGVAKIIFTATDGSGVSKEISIEVKPILADNITINEEELIELEEGESYTLKGFDITPIYHTDEVNVEYIPSDGITINDNILTASKDGNVEIYVNGKLIHIIEVKIKYEFVILSDNYDMASNTLTLVDDYALLEIKVRVKGGQDLITASIEFSSSSNLSAKLRMGRFEIERLANGSGKITLTSSQYNLKLEINVK